MYVQSYSSMKPVKLAYLSEGPGQAGDEGKHLSHRGLIYGKWEKAADEPTKDGGERKQSRKSFRLFN